MPKCPALEQPLLIERKEMREDTDLELFGYVYLPQGIWQLGLNGDLCFLKYRTYTCWDLWYED